jgi:hypothetical protein
MTTNKDKTIQELKHIIEDLLGGIVDCCEIGRRSEELNENMRRAWTILGNLPKEQKALQEEKPSAEFLEELVKQAKNYGWPGVDTEVSQFVEELYYQAELECPDLNPE